MTATQPGAALADPVLTVLALGDTDDVRRDTRDVCRMHARVLVMLGLDSAEPKGRELWAQPRRDRLVVQWRRPVDVRFLPDGYCTGVSVHPVRTEFLPGARVRFVVVVNPTSRVHPKVDGVRRGAGVVRQLDPAQYVRSRYRELDIHEVAVLDEHTVHGRKPSGGHRVTHRRARLAGTATVLDPGALAEHIRGGHGHAKAYGCGLLLVVSETDR